MRKLLLVLNLVFPVIAMGQKNYLGNGLYWQFQDGVLTISGKGDMPNEVSMDYPWYDLINNGNIRKIVIEEGVKSIEKRAFECYPEQQWVYNALKEVYLPSTLEKIGEDAFWGHEGLYNVDFGKGIKIIDDYAFQDCISLKEILLPDGIEKIGNGAFSRKRNFPIKRLSIPSSVKEIGYHAFSLTDRIGKEKFFYDCECLVELLPDWLSLDHCKSIGLSEKSYKSYLATKEDSYPAGSTNNDCYWFTRYMYLEFDGDGQPIKGSSKYMYPKNDDNDYEIQFYYTSNYQTDDYPIIIYLNEIDNQDKKVSIKELGKVNRAIKSSVLFSQDDVSIFVKGYQITVTSDGTILVYKTENATYKNCLYFKPSEMSAAVYKIRYKVLLEKLKSIKWGSY